MSGCLVVSENVAHGRFRQPAATGLRAVCRYLLVRSSLRHPSGRRLQAGQLLRAAAKWL